MAPSRPAPRKNTDDSGSDREGNRRRLPRKQPAKEEKTQLQLVQLGQEGAEGFGRSAGGASLGDVLDLLYKLMQMHELKYAMELISRLMQTGTVSSQLDLSQEDLRDMLGSVIGREPDNEILILLGKTPSNGDKPWGRQMSPNSDQPGATMLPGAATRVPSPGSSLTLDRTSSNRAQSPPSPNTPQRVRSAGQTRSRPRSGPRPRSSPGPGNTSPFSSPGVRPTTAERRPPSAQSIPTRPPTAGGEPPPLPLLPDTLPDPDQLRGLENHTLDDRYPTLNIQNIEEVSNMDTRVADEKRPEPSERWAHPPSRPPTNNNRLRPVPLTDKESTDIEHGDRRRDVSFQAQQVDADGSKLRNTAMSTTTLGTSLQKASSQASHSTEPARRGMALTSYFLRNSNKPPVNRQSTDVLAKKQQQKPAAAPVADSPHSTPMAGAHNETWWAIPSHQFIISPNGVLRITWDMLSLLAIINEAIIVPLSLLFDVATPEIMFITSTVFFTIDLVLNFLTGYFSDGVLVMKQHYIIAHYLRSWFPLDAASTFPWQLVFSGGNATMLKLAKFGKVMRVIRLLRVAKMGMLLEHLQDLFASAWLLVSLKLAKIVCFIGMLCHWVACFWGYLGHPDMHHGRAGGDPHDHSVCEPGGPCEASIMGSSWRRRYGVENDPLADQYLVALRFATGLFTGNDMGLQPGFWLERIFLIFMFFASMILGSTVISQIVMIFEGMRQERQEQDELMLSFKQFMSASQVPFQLQSKIKRYLEFQFKSRKELQVRRFELMQRLSPWLRKELQVHLNSNVLIQHRFFRDMPSEILAHMCCLAASALCAPGDVIVQHGQNLHVIFFVVKGRLSVSMAREHGDGQEFGSMDSMSPPEPPPNPTSPTGGSLLVTGASPNPTASMSLARQGTMTNLGGEELAGSKMQPLSDENDTVLSAPGWIGASSLFKEEVRPYTVSSLSNSELLKLAREDVNALLMEFPALNAYIQLFTASCEGSEEGFQDSSIKHIAERCERNRRSSELDM